MNMAGCGLALSGGGARGGAHAGVIKALEEQDLMPSLLAGTSAGAIVAGLYASGLRADRLKEILNHLSVHGTEYLDPDYRAMAEFFPRLLAGKPPSLSGLLKGDRLLDYFSQLTGSRRLDEAKGILVIPAVDLNTADTVVFTNAEQPDPLEHTRWEWEAYLCQAMMASASFPGIFAPRRMGGMLLADGGVTNNLPADLLQAAGAERVIAVDVGEVYCPPADSSLPELLFHAFSAMGRRLKECGNQEASLLLTPPLPEDAGLLTFSRLEECWEAGYRYTIRHIEEIRDWVRGTPGASCPLQAGKKLHG